MRKIKTFNESKTDGLIEDIKDICLELNDTGLKFHIYKNKQMSGNVYNIDVSYGEDENGEYEKTFEWSDVNEVVERLKRCANITNLRVMHTIDDGYDHEWTHIDKEVNYEGIKFYWYLHSICLLEIKFEL